MEEYNKYGWSLEDENWTKKNLRNTMKWLKETVEQMRLFIAVANGEQELDDNTYRKLRN